MRTIGSKNAEEASTARTEPGRREAQVYTVEYHGRTHRGHSKVMRIRSLASRDPFGEKRAIRHDFAPAGRGAVVTGWSAAEPVDGRGW